MNKAERWHRISALFDRVVELPASEREAVFVDECAQDPSLRQEVERLLAADERTSPVDQDIAGQASQLLLEGDPHELEGQHFGAYRIVKLLGQGGMGRVYLAEREGEDFAQTVALKLVGGYGSFDAYTARRRFLDERRILARLQHPNIARLLDGGVGPQAQPWFAMEYVDGAPLTQWCDAQRQNVRDRLILFAKVCEAVDHAHRFLIVHRDLKPGNVLVDGHGEPKVLDFGIAKLLDEGGPSDRTGSTILMTPDYAAPEQIRGGQISTATDVYALGAVLFEVLTGRKPFEDPLAPRQAPQASKIATDGQNTGERAHARATTPQALRKHLRGDLDRILRTALDPDPSRRYRSAATLAQDLRAVADGRAISLRKDTGYRLKVFLRRHKWETAAATIAVLGLLGTTGWALWQREQTVLQARIALQESRTAISVKNLITGMFSSASPEVSLGRALTVKEVLDSNRNLWFNALGQEPEVAAELLTLLAKTYASLGDHKQAWTLLDRAVTLAPRLDSGHRAAIYFARFDLAYVQGSRKGMQSEAFELRRLIKDLKEPGIRVSALTALALHAEVESLDGDAFAEEAFNIANGTMAPSDVRRLQAARVLAISLGSSGELARKERLLLQGLAQAERSLPPTHPESIRYRRDLFAHYWDLRAYQKSLPYGNRILSDSIAVYGEKSLATANARLNVGRTSFAAGAYADASSQFQKALQIFESASGKQSLEHSAAELQYAAALEALGELDQALVLYEQALKRYERTDRESKSLPHMRLNIARVQLEKGWLSKAEDLYSEVREMPQVGVAARASAISGMGTIARLRGNPEQALKLHLSAARLLEDEQSFLRGLGQSYLMSVQLEIALDLERLGRPYESANVAAGLLRKLDDNYPFKHPELKEAYLLQARNIGRSKKKNEGEVRRLLSRYADLCRTMYGKSDVRTIQARARLGRQ